MKTSKVTKYIFHSGIFRPDIVDKIDISRIHNMHGFTLSNVVCFVTFAVERMGHIYIALFQIANSFKQAIKSNDGHLYEIWPYQRA